MYTGKRRFRGVCKGETLGRPYLPCAGVVHDRAGDGQADWGPAGEDRSEDARSNLTDALENPSQPYLPYAGVVYDRAGDGQADQGADEHSLLACVFPHECARARASAPAS